MEKIYSKDEVLKMLDEQIAAVGSARAWAKAHDIAEAYLSDVRNNRRQPGDKFLKAMGITRGFVASAP